MNTFRWTTAVAALAVLLGLAIPGQAADDKRPEYNIDEALESKILPILDAVKERAGKDNPVVGTLKFQARFKGGKPSFTFGPITSVMAERLQLLMALGQEKTLSVPIIHQASEVAAKNKLDHTTAKGIKGLFEHKYKLMTAGDPRSPDLFLTGVVTIDLEKGIAEVELATVGPKSKAPEPLEISGEKAVVAHVDRLLLSEAGQSFTMNARQIEKTRGAFDRHEADDNATNQVKTQRVKEVKDPEKPGEELVKLRMFVKPAGGEEREVVFEADTANPGSKLWKTDKPLQKGDEVYFRLKPCKDERLAVVLKVNGMSTLYQLKEDPLVCSKWILEKGTDPLTVTGFYTKDEGENLIPFEVLTESEAQAQNLMADANAGTIQMHVYIEGKPPRQSRSFPVTRGLSARKWESKSGGLKTLDDLNKLFVWDRKESKAFRGLIAPSSRLESGHKLEQRAFENPQEVQSLTVEYFKRTR